MKLKQIIKIPNKKEMIGTKTALAFESGWNACLKEIGNIEVPCCIKQEHLYRNTKKEDAGRLIGECVYCGYIVIGLLPTDFIIPLEVK